jgi:hypothetical protein
LCSWQTLTEAAVAASASASSSSSTSSAATAFCALAERQWLALLAAVVSKLRASDLIAFAPRIGRLYLAPLASTTMPAAGM